MIIDSTNRFVWFSINLDGEVDPDLGRGQWRRIVWRGPLKKICPKYIILGIFGVNWGDLGTSWSDFRMQNHSVSLLGLANYPKITNEYSKHLEL